jgi:hypothetical protein
VDSLNAPFVSLFSLREAEGFKDQGNAFYVKKDYSEAFNYYTKAIGENATLALNPSLVTTC